MPHKLWGRASRQSLKVLCVVPHREGLPRPGFPVFSLSLGEAFGKGPLVGF